MKLPFKFPKPIERAYDWVKAVFKEFSEDNGGITAAAISFYVFISLIPLALIAVAVFGYVLGSQEQSREAVLRSLEQAIPTAEAASGIQELIGGIISGSGPAGIIGFILLLWSGSSVFVNLGKAMNITWNSDVARGFVKDRLIAIGMLLLIGLLLLLSFALTAAANLILRQEIFGYRLGGIPFIWQILGYVLPLFVSIAMFTLIYKILPTADVPWKTALVGGITAGILWDLLKMGFTWYLTNFANFGAVYGSLATVIILVLWIYYSSIITVLGAEVCQVYEHRQDTAAS